MKSKTGQELQITKKAAKRGFKQREQVKESDNPFVLLAMINRHFFGIFGYSRIRVVE